LVAFVSESRFGLVETLAERCAALVLDEFAVHKVKLKLSKPGAVRGAAAVGVIIKRRRAGADDGRHAADDAGAGAQREVAAAGIPVVELPVAEAPVVEAPVVEAPVVEAPEVEPPGHEAPVDVEPAVEPPP